MIKIYVHLFRLSANHVTVFIFFLGKLLKMVLIMLLAKGLYMISKWYISHDIAALRGNHTFELLSDLLSMFNS